MSDKHAPRWFIHMDEGTLKLALQVVETTIVAIKDSTTLLWNRIGVDEWETWINHSSNSGTRILFSESQLEVDSRSAVSGADLPRVEIFGKISYNAITDRTVMTLEFLEEWRSGLSTPFDDKCVKEAEEYANLMNGALSVGAITASLDQWICALIEPKTNGCHGYFVTKTLTESLCFERFDGAASRHRMSRGLTAILDRLAVGRLHVTGEYARGGKTLRIFIGEPPEIIVLNNETLDSVTILRAVQQLPPDVRLIEAS